MQRTKSTTCYFDYSLNQLVQADNSGGVHPGFTIPETKQEQEARQEQRTRERRETNQCRIQRDLALLSQLQQETLQIRAQRDQFQASREELQEKVKELELKPEEVVLSGLSPEQLEELLEPWEPTEELTPDELQELLSPWSPETEA